MRKTVQGRPVYDERMLCHSPQERLFIDGAWREGLLPPPEALPAAERGADAGRVPRLRRRRRRARRRRGVRDPDRALALDTGAGGARRHHLRRLARRPRPASRRPCAGTSTTAAATTTAPAPRRSRPGPGCTTSPAGTASTPRAATTGRRPTAATASSPGRKATPGWPSGWPRRSASACSRAGWCCASAKAATRVEVDAWNAATQAVERWSAPRVVVATPLFVAARLLESPPPALLAAVAAMRHAPWLVANLQLDAALDDRPGAPPSWDNVPYGSAAPRLRRRDAPEHAAVRRADRAHRLLGARRPERGRARRASGRAC